MCKRAELSPRCTSRKRRFESRRKGRAMNRIPLVGEPAPDFAAAAYHDGLEVELTLSQYRGWWVVLIFYPGDFTCVCPTEIAAAAVKYPAFRELGAELLAVSSDPVEVHRDFQEQVLAGMVHGGARFPLVADPLGRIGSLYGVHDSNLQMHLRSHFIIDPAGVIQSLQVVAAPLGRSITEILRQLRALKEHQISGHMIPCGWEHGRATLPEKDTSGERTKSWETWKPREAF